MLYKSSALRTIHITGHSAKTAPFAIAASANPTGIAHTVTAITNPTKRPAKAACQAGRLSNPRQIKTVAIGNTPTRKDSPRLLPTGVNNWWNIFVILPNAPSAAIFSRRHRHQGYCAGQVARSARFEERVSLPSFCASEVLAARTRESIAELIIIRFSADQ
jgi:hypothetical protein